MADPDSISKTVSRVERAAIRARARELLLSGMTLSEIAKQCGRTTSWVRLACPDLLERPRYWCLVCSAELVKRRPSGRARTFCSDSCRRLHNRPASKRACLGCGKKCSGRECRSCRSDRIRREQTRPCVICGLEFTHTDRKRECCSLVCGRALGAKRQGWGTGIETIRCEGCMQEFRRKRNRCRDAGRFCTRECYWNWRRSQIVWPVPRANELTNLGSRRRDARKRNAIREPVDLIKVLQRDKWTCQECGVGTPRSLRGTMNERAPECDHIVSLANGGAHTYANLQCLCRRCNRRKGARTRGQLGLPLSA
jgi:hypothetical protein